MLSNVVRATIRTYVPILVTVLVDFFARYHIPVDSQGLVIWLDGAAGGAYYSLALWLEKRWPKLGWLLGAKGRPQYGESE